MQKGCGKLIIIVQHSLKLLITSANNLDVEKDDIEDDEDEHSANDEVDLGHYNFPKSKKS